MSRPLVTVFIPMYKSEQYISECIDSILNQTYKNLEILVIDDGSTDNSVNIIKSYTDPRIRLLQNESNKGIPYTRNRGLQELKGKYLAVMDSDDISYLTRIEDQVEFMEAHPEVTVLGTFFETYRRFISSKFTRYRTPEELKVGLLFECQIANPTAMIRVQTLKDYGIQYNEECFVAQDYEIWTQIVKYSSLAILPKVLHKYRWGHANVTQKSRQAKIERRKRIISNIHNNMLDFYQFNLTNEDKRVFNTLFCDSEVPQFTDAFIQQVNVVLNKLEQHVQSENIFDIEVYKKILNEILFTKISQAPNTLKEKYNYYHLFIGRNFKSDMILFKHHVRENLKKALRK